MTYGEKEGLGGGVIGDGRLGSQGMRVREGRVGGALAVVTGLGLRENRGEAGEEGQV